MLHKCFECGIVYLVSDYSHLCNLCGEYLRQRIERLHEIDDAVEWWRICSRAMFNYDDSEPSHPLLNLKTKEISR